jgi:succinyl-diaminopimelate desuccinylase
MKDLLSKIIAFQTDKSHPQELKKCFAFIVDYLTKAGLKVKTYSSNNRSSLIAAKKLKKHYQYIMCGHLDVVPANYLHAFSPILRGNFLYGRGASDMKGPIAVMINAVKNLKNTDVALMLTSDEEVGGFDGVNYLLNQEKYSCDCVIIPDGGDNWHLTIAEKGLLHLKITASGKTAHGSRPWLGDNAIDRLIKAYTQIKQQLPTLKRDNHWQPTVNLGKIAGGLATNMVPDKAEMYLDFRFPETKDKNQIIELLKKITSSIRGLTYQVVAEGNATLVVKSNPYVQKIIKSAKKQNIDLKFLMAHGASDGRFFAEKNIPVIMFKPVCSEPHTKNEWIDLKSLEVFQKILSDFLVN